MDVDVFPFVFVFVFGLFVMVAPFLLVMGELDPLIPLVEVVAAGVVEVVVVVGEKFPLDPLSPLHPLVEGKSIDAFVCLGLRVLVFVEEEVGSLGGRAVAGEAIVNIECRRGRALCR